VAGGAAKADGYVNGDVPVLTVEDVVLVDKSRVGNPEGSFTYTGL
jgi:hypothetical protein